MQYPFLECYADGTIWRAGHTVLGLCNAWNAATNPALPMTDWEHHRAKQYARAIRARMKRLGYTYGHEYTELSNGMLWPVKLLWRFERDKVV